MKKTSRSTVILFGVCAVIWTVRAIFDVIYQTYNISVFTFVLNLICALLWIAAFIRWLKRYRAQQADEEK